jgi:histidine ammonia-lyase
MKTIVLTGSNLSLEDIYAIAHDRTARVKIDPKAIKRVEQAEHFLETAMRKKVIYGVNTGFGPMASHIIGRDELIALQKNLIHGHAVGMGDPLPQEYVIAAMVVRLNTLLKGYSGISAGPLRRLERFINEGIVPVVPEHGAVGTSGDLVQLAHIGLAIIGEGEVFYEGKRQSTAAVLKKHGIPEYALKEKEGLSLINGTSMMTGISALLCIEAERLVSIAIRNAACALESVNSFTDSISETLHALRPHDGQQDVAKILRTLTASSKLMRNRHTFQNAIALTDKTHTIPESVQEVYSFRCIPQVIGPILDTLRTTAREVEIEVNSVTDNPIIDVKGKAFLHGGNFHGEYIAVGIDQLKAAIVKLTMLTERRINFFMHRAINKSFPPFLNLKTPGLTMGLQGLQFVATSTTARSQTLAFPQHIHSIPTNGDNQDIVSMGTDASIMTGEVVENAYIVLTIEMVTLGQLAQFAVEKKKKYSLPSQAHLRDIQKNFPPIIEDRKASDQLASILRHAKKSAILDMDWRNE